MKTVKLNTILRSKIVISVVSLIAIVVGLNACTSAPVYQGGSSSHFNGNVFSNQIKSTKTPWDMVKLFSGFLYYKQTWPGWVDNDPSVVGEMVSRSDALRITFINHSSFLIQVDNLNILTDPVYSDRVSPFPWVGPARVRAPGIAFDALPPIDVVLISHNHYDHLDIEFLERLTRRQRGNEPMLLAGLGNGGLFSQRQLPNFSDLDWGQGVDHGGLRFTFVESRHRSGRGITDQMKTLWGSFVVETSHGPLYFAGDTGYGPHFLDAQKQFGNFFVALLPIGAYEPRWFMKEVHLNPEEAVQAHRDLGASHSLSMHFGTFQLTHEGISQPAMDLTLALDSQAVSAEIFRVPQFGETLLYPKI